MCNYWFSTAAVVTGTCLNVTMLRYTNIYCMSCLLHTSTLTGCELQGYSKYISWSCLLTLAYFLTLVLFTFWTCCILRSFVCIVVSCLACIVVVVLCALLSTYVYLLYCVCIAVFTLDAGLLARSQYSEGPATGHLDTGFSQFPCVYKQMLRWFPTFQVATTCF